jgi:ABC-type thiamine transport system substrate-binding protein
MPCITYYYQASTLEQSKMNERNDFEKKIEIFYDTLLTKHAGHAINKNSYDQINSKDDLYISVVNVYLSSMEGNILFAYVKTNEKEIKTNAIYSDNLFNNAYIIRQFVSSQDGVRRLIIHSDK